MVCSANDLLGWKDFPKGLRVLLLVEEDTSSVTQMTSKLQEMDYIVDTFYNENEALLAISNNSAEFHIAIVEVSANNSDGRFKFLENAKDMPTIMTSDMQCLSTMMKCIALGAVEFLKKPLSDDKLRNIWQHVVHKAFNAGKKDQFEFPQPIKESQASMLISPSESEEPKKQNSVKKQQEIQILENISQLQEPKNQTSLKTEEEVQIQENIISDVSAAPPASDKYPALLTPQTKQGVGSVDDGECQDQTNLSTDKESGDYNGESKSVEMTAAESPRRRVEEVVVKDKEVLVTGSKDESDSSSHNPNINGSERSCVHGRAANIVTGVHSPCKVNRKRTKVDWTHGLHNKFVQAVEQLGIEQAIPSRILELMKVEGLTRHNVASHLQKYRMQRRHILPKEDDRRWPNTRDTAQRSSYFSHKPIMAFPPYHSNHPLRTGQFYPSWVSPNGYQAGAQMWHPPYYPTWQSTDTLNWPPNYLGLHADAWGCPVMPAPLGQSPSFPQGSVDTMQNNHILIQHPHDFHPAEEVIDEVVKEAINKPWLPLPLGLKPPSTDSVLAQLSKQGVSTIPPNCQADVAPPHGSRFF